MRGLASELAPHMVRINSVHPANVHSPMIDNDVAAQLFAGGPFGAQFDDADVTRSGLSCPRCRGRTWSRFTSARRWVNLASEDTRYVTGTTHVVHLGRLLVEKIPHLAH